MLQGATAVLRRDRPISPCGKHRQPLLKVPIGQRAIRAPHQPASPACGYALTGFGQCAALFPTHRPIFTVEQELGAANGRGAMALLREVELLGFRAHMVPEICGKERDCRNFICVPLERPLTARLLVRNTVPVNASSFNHKELLRVPIISPSHAHAHVWNRIRSSA